MRFETAGNGSKNRIFTPFGDFYIDVENLVDQVMGSNNPFTKQGDEKQPDAAKPARRPATYVTESETAFTVSIDLPGVAASDVSIELLDQELTVSGSRQSVEVAEGDRVLQPSRLSGPFLSTVRFEPLVDDDGVEASFDLGVLTIVIPKAAKAVAKKIEIKTSAPQS